MNTSKDPYGILGVPRSATQDQIKAAYRRLAKQHHPDRNPSNRAAAEQRFKEIHAAYEVLGDQRRRAEYDRFGAGGPRPDVRNWATGAPGGVSVDDVQFDFASLGDLSSIFEQFFSRRGAGGFGGMREPERERGARARRSQPRPAAVEPGPDLETSADLSFEEAVRGATREIRLTTGEPSQADEVIRFRVPPGVREGQRIRVRGKGQEGPGGRGDLLIRCHIRPHPYFRREDNDILLEVPVTVHEALLGTQVDIPTLDGVTVVKIPPGTSSGTKLRLRGRGVKDARTGAAGDMYAVVRIVIPKALSPRGTELVRQLAPELDTQPRARLGWAT